MEENLCLPNVPTDWIHAHSLGLVILLTLLVLMVRIWCFVWIGSGGPLNSDPRLSKCATTFLQLMHFLGVETQVNQTCESAW